VGLLTAFEASKKSTCTIAGMSRAFRGASTTAATASVTYCKAMEYVSPSAVLLLPGSHEAKATDICN